MNRHLAAISLSALSIVVLVAGCQKSADQQSSPDANATPSMAEAAKTAVKKAIAPKPLVIPADTVIAVVLDQTITSKFKGGAALSLTLTSVTVNGRDHEIQTSGATMSSKGKGKRTAVMVGGGAAGGAAIGAVAGGGKGAAIGALIGAAAGTGGAGLTGNRDITLAAETALDFKLLQPLTVKQK